MIGPKKVPALLHPFNKIGLCFSGGGYRASAFSLGVLAYLDRVPFGRRKLLDHVTAISTVSGGTITGASFATSVAKQEPFSLFYSRLYTFLDEDMLLERAKAIMLDNTYWTGTSKRRTLINAFAAAYEELLVQGDFDDLNELLKSHTLKYVCFNATEFSYGLTFRFQNTGTFGNHFLKNKNLNAIKGRIKIADVIASSSCFPVGFEPLLFPDDYFSDHQDEAYLTLKEQPIFAAGVGIMDGGIVDNQGIGSMVKIDQSRKEDLPLDLVVVNDVGSFAMPRWEPSVERPQNSLTGSLKHYLTKITDYFKLKPIYWLSLLLGLSLLGYSSFAAGTNTSFLLGISGGYLAGVGTVLTLLGIIGTLWSISIQQKAVGLLKANIPQVLWDDLDSLQKLDVSVIQRMLMERISSSFTMINYIFIRQLRRLNYELLFSKEQYKNRRISTTIYQMSEAKSTLETIEEREYKQHCISEIKGLGKIRKSAKIASKMPTTLWWNAEDRKRNRLDNIVACGQFTTCFNLIDYIEKLPVDMRNEEIDMLLEFLKKDWQQFKIEPLAFLPHVK
jgi:predicted acylesterase/phospholipase RssA